ncbi:MAG: hypothetical protein ACYS99_04455 [Planctomycetota bacterium]|jgi:hypothetical protein
MAPDEDRQDQPAPEGTSQVVEQKAPEKIERTVLRPYPKIVYFYLTWIGALVCGIATTLADSTEAQQWWTRIFLWIFTFNLLVVAFEFTRMVSVALLGLVLAFVFLGLWLEFLGDIFGWLKELNPRAEPSFFFFVFIVFTVIFLLVFIKTRFNYWVVRGNELLHKHGFLGDVKRYRATDVKITKEIPDVLEFLLLRAGTMVLYPAHEQRAIVLENIIGINRKEKEVKEILESFAVRLEKS